MEKNGIGRPSTYTSTIETLKARSYVTSKSGILTPTDQGKCTVTYLETYFSDFVNPMFTANMEKQLDEVKDGNNSSLGILTDFYNELSETIAKAGGLPEGSECRKDLGICPQCGIGHLIEQTGKYGKFIACDRFPTCRYIHKEPKEPAKKIGRLCPLCGHDLIERKSIKKGTPFIGCSAFPKCKCVESIKVSKDQD
ncbi:MAG: topoisomerase DNA-binding C4 zinc finger domain-containing protein [Rhodopseudomonas palustris]|nr:topoisomerase DNA-binding C4 zinc finger domain-containing protein [Rhodopseudomonas palustris]